MAQYATEANLALAHGLTFTASDSARADLLLELVSDEVQAYCTKVDFEQTTDDEVELRGTWEDELELPGLPVASVSEVLVDGTEVSSYRLVRGSLWRTPSVEGFDTFLGGYHWGGPSRTVTVTYTHGFAVVPGIVRSVVLRAAARVWTNPEQRASVQLESGYRTDFGESAAGVWLTAGDLMQLRSAGYRR